MRFILFLIACCVIAAFCSCSKQSTTEYCKTCIILSEKYSNDKRIVSGLFSPPAEVTLRIYLRTDTLYQDVLCGHWLQVFRENKKIWDLDTGFVVCDRYLFERRIYIVK